ncbi:MAG: hypothetical protein RL227_348 [Pseudomonadota bacterium]|jgi:hypothetical protein
MKDEDPRYISADGPANPRHARHEPVPPARVSEEALARVQRVHARHLLGAPLQVQMRAAAPAMRQTTHPVQIGSVIGAAAGGVVLLLGAIQSSPSVVVPGAALLAAGLATLAWWSRRHPVSRALGAAAPLFDDETMNRFDTALEEASAALDEPQCQQLLALKGSLVRIGTRAASVATDEHFTLDHRMYLLECLRRYIPDSLQAYLRVPASQRHSTFADQGDSAATLLSRQLSLLQDEVDRREEALGRSATEGLRRQQRFLEAKRRG